MIKSKKVITALILISFLASACQSKKSGCPGSFHQKAQKTSVSKSNV